MPVIYSENADYAPSGANGWTFATLSSGVSGGVLWINTGGAAAITVTVTSTAVAQNGGAYIAIYDSGFGAPVTSDPYPPTLTEWTDHVFTTTLQQGWYAVVYWEGSTSSGTITWV